MASSKIQRLDRNLPLPKIVYQFLSQPIDRLKEAMGLTAKTEMLAGPDFPTSGTYPVSLTKLDTSFSLGTTDYDVYNFKAWLILTQTGGVGAYADLGMINVSEGFLLPIRNATNISADDTSGAGGWTNTAIANTGSLVEDTAAGSQVIAPTLLYFNQDDGGGPIEDQYLYLAAFDANDIECEVYVDIDFIAEKGAKVELIRF